MGGIASGLTEQSFIAAKQDGVVRLVGVRTVTNSEGNDVILSRKAQLIVESADGRELQSQSLEYGTVLLVKNQQQVKKNTKLAEWDPNNKVLITEQGGRVRYIDLIDNVTMQESIDDATGKSSRMVTEAKTEKYQPAVSIIDADDKELAHYFLPSGAILTIEDNGEIAVGDALVKMPREASKSEDIAGGLPRIAELFEARMPKDPALISDIDGEVVIGGLHRGLRKLTVTSGADSYDYFVPRGKQLNVVDGEHVNAGDQLTIGAPVLHDMLRILGPDVVQNYLVDQIQQIYRLTGVEINDRHIEIIVRQMMRKVRIVHAGDSDFLVGDRVDRIHFSAVNAVLRSEGKKVAVAKPVLMGITQASLGTESFISAASFQETTRILAEASVAGQVDHLYGLKENVIVGKLIPAGTGVSSFRAKYLGDDVSELEKQAREEEMQREYQPESDSDISL
ncbi:MAG: hypothetical protein ACD_6C00248G0001, partial [uncultured bacterium]